jgi:uncharacterized protein (DUF169 family)
MNWTEITAELLNMLRLKTDPLAFKRLEKADDLEQIKNVYRIPYLFSFCQAVFQARVQRITIGITKEDKMNIRCMRLHGVRHASEKTMKAEAEMLSTTWFGSADEAYRQQLDSPRVPVAEAVVMAPLSKNKFEPDVILIFGNPAQLMMLLCGLQKEKYERFDFHFVGEGSCSDSLGECYRTGKPQISLPCYGERSMGQVSDDEIILALPPVEMERAVSGMKKLAKIGFKYPINFIGGITDLEPIMKQVYPSAFGK